MRHELLGELGEFIVVEHTDGRVEVEPVYLEDAGVGQVAALPSVSAPTSGTTGGTWMVIPNAANRLGCSSPASQRSIDTSER